MRGSASPLTVWPLSASLTRAFEADLRRVVDALRAEVTEKMQEVLRCLVIDTDSDHNLSSSDRIRRNGHNDR